MEWFGVILDIRKINCLVTLRTEQRTAAWSGSSIWVLGVELQPFTIAVVHRYEISINTPLSPRLIHIYVQSCHPVLRCVNLCS